jgi:hypothetical protein
VSSVTKNFFLGETMKKAIFAAAIMLISVPAFALSANSSWEQINASYDYIVQPAFQGFGGAFNVCATADAIQSIKPVTVCTQWSEPTMAGDISVAPVCLHSEAKTVSIPRHGVTQACAQWASNNGGDIDPGMHCVKYVDQAYDISLNQSLNVLYAGGEQYGQVAFTKSFTIPACN